MNMKGITINEMSEINNYLNRDNRRSTAEIIYDKVSRVITCPESWSRKIRSQMSKDTYPFVTMNQLIRQMDEAISADDDYRAELIQEVIDTMIAQEIKDGFPGSEEDALDFLKNHVAVGRLLAADIKAVYHQYVTTCSDDPFIHIPKLVKARAVATKLKNEMIRQELNSRIKFIVRSEEALGFAGTEKQVLDRIHSTELS